MQSNPNRIYMGWADYWFRPFCNCCYKNESFSKRRAYRPHTHQKRRSKVITLRTHRGGRL